MAQDNTKPVFELNTNQHIRSINKPADRIKVTPWFYLFLRYPK